MHEPDRKILIGISSCLLGEKVRYDGGHKLDTFLRDTLGKYVEFVPVCPELEAGLGVPREAMRLLRAGDSVRLAGVRTGIDFTEKLERWADRRVRELEKEGLSGFVFKSGSPSSGLRRVKVYTESGTFSKTGSGIFARIFMRCFPLLPVEDEGRLHDPEIRENFIERIFVCRRWRGRGKGTSGIVEFHTRHKLLILSHSESISRKLGRLVARAGSTPLESLSGQYEKGLLQALRLKATVRKNSNVLEHVLGYFKKDLPTPEKQELQDIISSYRKGVIPLIVPITLMAHYVRQYDKEFLKEQIYLDPHPVELQLRNHA